VKVAFIGTHGTGKTTLCFRLAAHLKMLDLNVDIVKEVARSAPLPLNRNTTLDAQLWILHTQIANEIASARDHDVVVCDRSALDNYAYLVYRFGRRLVLDALVREWMESYTALFRVPVLRSPSYDGVRDTSPSYQQEIDTLVTRLLAEFEVEVTPLSLEDPDGWLTEILDHLSLPQKPPQLRLIDPAEG
jgi:nicotinamide riboside kinase